MKRSKGRKPQKPKPVKNAQGPDRTQKFGPEPEDYLARAKEIIGPRTLTEIAYDTAVVERLIAGDSIETALAAAAIKYPNEALEWNDETIGDIAGHYEYQREHALILTLLRSDRGDKVPGVDR